MITGKKFLSLTTASCIIPLFVVFNSHAQITITSNDIASAGNTLQLVMDTAPVVLPGLGGANQTWNFSNLNNHGIIQYNLLDPAVTPYGNPFSSYSTFAINTPPDSSYYYYVNTTGSLEHNGWYYHPFNSMTLVDFIPDRVIAVFPIAYLNSYGSMYGFDFSFYYGQGGIDSIKLTGSGWIYSIYDGWGTVITPVGTYPTVRQKERDTSVSEIYGYIGGNWVSLGQQHDTTYTYRWWTNAPNTGWPVVEMEYDSVTSTVSVVRWLYSSTAPVNETNLVSPLLEGYPNPATYYLTIPTGKAGNYVIDIYHLSGKSVAKHEVHIDSPQCTVKIENLLPGSYIYVVRDKDTNQIKVGRFVKK